VSWATRIREARDARGWTQDELAERLGVSRAVVSRWENGHTPPTVPEQVNALVLALGLSPEELLREMGVRLTSPAAARLPRELTELLLAMSPAQQRALLELIRPLAHG
jgi:transcriptional regulator with XRE-family HTH domain